MLQICLVFEFGRLRQVAHQILRWDLYLLLLNAQVDLELRSKFDLFLFTDDWRERLDYYQEALPHEDPNFMRNIARDAIKLA